MGESAKDREKKEWKEREIIALLGEREEKRWTKLRKVKRTANRKPKVGKRIARGGFAVTLSLRRRKGGVKSVLIC